jgi:hypothetical protein
MSQYNLSLHIVNQKENRYSRIELNGILEFPYMHPILKCFYD